MSWISIGLNFVLALSTAAALYGLVLSQRQRDIARGLFVNADERAVELGRKARQAEAREQLYIAAYRTVDEEASRLKEQIAALESYQDQANQYVIEAANLVIEVNERVGRLRNLIVHPAAANVWDAIATDDRLIDLRPHLLTVKHTIIAAASNLPVPTIDPPTPPLEPSHAE